MSRPYIRQEILEVALFKMILFQNPSSVKFQGIIMKFLLFFPGEVWVLLDSHCSQLSK
jgi:hypothetical protein